MNLDNIFRAYDIRGVFGKDLTEEVAARIGAAFATFLKGKEVLVARDVRLSGEKLRNALVSSLVSGCNVTDIGIVPTPLVYFAINRLQKDAGIMVTASHNPPEWNGFKAFRRKGTIYGRDMEKIKRIAKEIDLENLSEKRGRLASYEGIIQEYIDFVEKKMEIKRKLKVVADTTNGACGLVAPSLFKRLGCNILILNENPDGRFPAHLPEPKEETLGELKREVVKNKADLGVGYDGDGDRVVFVDEKGNMIPGDLTLMIFARDVLQKEKGAKIVYELSCSMALEEYVKELGGVPLVERVGHTFIMDRIIRENALLGGEKSSHFYFAEVYGVDDAVFASLKMAEILSKNREKLSEIVDSLPKYPSIYEKNFDCPDEVKFAVVEKLKTRFRDYGLKLLGIDGVKLLDKEGWVLLRPSNTEPIIRVSAEAKTEEKLRELYEFARKELEQVIKGG